MYFCLSKILQETRALLPLCPLPRPDRRLVPPHARRHVLQRLDHDGRRCRGHARTQVITKSITLWIRDDQ